MKSKWGTYISELNENINYSERTLKWGSSCRPLSLLEKRLDAMPGDFKIILYRWVLIEIMSTLTYRQELISFMVNHNVRTGTSRNIYGSRVVGKQRGLRVRYRSVSFELCSNTWIVNGTDLLTWSCAICYNAWPIGWRVFSSLSCGKRSVHRRNIGACRKCIQHIQIATGTFRWEYWTKLLFEPFPRRWIVVWGCRHGKSQA